MFSWTHRSLYLDYAPKFRRYEQHLSPKADTDYNKRHSVEPMMTISLRTMPTTQPLFATGSAPSVPETSTLVHFGGDTFEVIGSRGPSRPTQAKPLSARAPTPQSQHEATLNAVVGSIAAVSLVALFFTNPLPLTNAFKVKIFQNLL